MAKIVATPRSFSRCQAARELLELAGHEVIIENRGRPLTAPELIEVLKSKDVSALIAGVDEINDEVIAQGAPALKIIARNGVGYNQVDVEAAKRHGVRVTIAPGANSLAVGEMAVALMLELARRVGAMDSLVRQGKWARLSGCELSGKTLGLIGAGHIGAIVASRAKAFGMRVLIFDVTPNPDLVEWYGVEYVDFDTVVQEADYLSLHLPLMESTKGIISRSVLESMKKGACLINTARGELVDEDALYDVLRDCHLRGAALDVFAQEPFGDKRFMNLDNVIMTPHAGAYTDEATERTLLMVAEDVLHVLRGEEPEHMVV